MTGKTHTSSQTWQSNFDTDGVSIGIDNNCPGTMLHSKHNFLGALKKGRRIISKFEGPKVHTIYESTIAWTINEYFSNIYKI